MPKKSCPPPPNNLTDHPLAYKNVAYGKGSIRLFGSGRQQPGQQNLIANHAVGQVHRSCIPILAHARIFGSHE